MYDEHAAGGVYRYRHKRSVPMAKRNKLGQFVKKTKRSASKAKRSASANRKKRSHSRR